MAAVFSDVSGTVWISAARTLKSWSGDSVITHFSLLDDDEPLPGRDLVVAGDGSVWFLGPSRLARWKDGRLDRYSPSDGLPDGDIRALHQDDDGVVWIGSYGRGLARLEDGNFVRYTVQDGLADNFVLQILEDDDGKLWMNGNRALSYVSRTELNMFARGETERIHPTAFGPRDGFAEGNSSQKGAHKSADGRLWFSSIDGLMMVDPVNWSSNALPPPVIIETFAAGDSVYGPGDIRVPPRTRNLEFRYTALSLGSPENIHFRYRLERYDDDWVEAGSRRTAFYSEVPPGSYVFTVIASNDEGVWNETGASLQISVLPAFWVTWWFLAASALLVLAVALTAHRMRVSSLRRHRDALQASESRFRGASEGSLDGFFLLESVRDASGVVTDFTFVDVNQRGAALLGGTRDELLGQYLCDVLPLTRESGNFQRYVEVLETGVPLEEERQPLPGSVIQAEWLRQQVVRVGDGVAVTTRDVSEARRAAAAHEELQHQLLQSQKMEAVGLLAGGLAHDFNNILTAVMGNAELAMLGVVDDPRETLPAIMHAAERGASLTTQLLAFTRKQITKPTVLDPNRQVLGVHSMVRRTLGSDLDLVTLPGDAVPLIEVDPGQFDQVMLNLIVNGRDAMPSGGTLTVATRAQVFDADDPSRPPTLDPGEYVAVSVSDTGCGIPAETLSRVFEPLYTTKGPGQGTGLGLATCRRIVEDHGGAIELASKVDVGTTFTVFLPAVEGPAGDLAVDDRFETEVLAGDETILMVEDNEQVRAVLSTALENQGYTVLVAGFMAEALDIVERHEDVRVLVTDLVLPQHSGLRLAREVLERRPDVGVVFISGHIGSERGEELAATGYDFLQKPFPPSDLVRKIREVLDREDGGVRND